MNTLRTSLLYSNLITSCLILASSTQVFASQVKEVCVQRNSDHSAMVVTVKYKGTPEKITTGIFDMPGTSVGSSIAYLANPNWYCESSGVEVVKPNLKGYKQECRPSFEDFDTLTGDVLNSSPGLAPEARGFSAGPGDIINGRDKAALKTWATGKFKQVAKPGLAPEPTDGNEQEPFYVGLRALDFVKDANGLIDSLKIDEENVGKTKVDEKMGYKCIKPSKKYWEGVQDANGNQVCAPLKVGQAQPECKAAGDDSHGDHVHGAQPTAK